MDDLDVLNESPHAQPNAHSGITLVLPSLRALQAANAGRKSKPKPAASTELPKIPRPVKLKPLKEVLTKLIAQIKKKDDYAFFIHPVDPAQVPGYADAIKNPMDFGTMTAKVAKGKYRSLEDFTTDFRLVTANAKAFNPPGSIYYTEADRLESWGLEHIARVSAHVIEYETDWNIDIEQDEDGSTSQLPANIDDEVSTPRDFDGSLAAGSPAPSMTPAPGQGKRGPRGPYKKHLQTPLSEGLDAEGRLPGVKDGVGVFPPGSDWAELMIALKIKGKRYKTKKERLRFEREGPPYHADGSLDYAEMEDPFSVLNVFAPEPPARPQLAPLYLPTTSSTSTPMLTPDGSQPYSQISQPRISAPIPVVISSDRPSLVLSTLSNPATQHSTAVASPKKRRHWTVIRNASARSRGKDKDGDATADDAKTTLKVSRDAGPVDYGSFATFLGELAAPTAPSQPSTVLGGTAVGSAAEYVYGSEHRLFATIRSTVEHRGIKRKCETDTHEEVRATEGDEKSETFWTDERAEEAWDYLRDVVYGGVDGYAYVRSLAEFVAPPVYLGDGDARKLEGGNDEGGDGGVDEKLSPQNYDDAKLPLGVPLARYVEDSLVDMVTRGRHGWLRDVLLPATMAIMRPTCASVYEGAPSPFHARLAALPDAARTVASFQERNDSEPLDMAALIRIPEELEKERELEGGEGEGGEQVDIERALSWSFALLQELVKRVGRREKDGSDDEDVKVKEEAVDDMRMVEGRSGMAMNVDVDRRPGTEDDNADAGSSRPQSRPKLEPDAPGEAEEDPLVRRLRLNLLALAKRAPLDKIAKLPPELVPEHIRGIVPTAS